MTKPPDPHPRKQEDVRDALAERPLVFDGAMGTLLYEQGYFINRAFDEANLVAADSVLRIHEAYRKAGAEILETNTFSANRFLLSRYGIPEKVEEVNRAGVRLARRAAGDEAWVAGSVGPTGEGLGVIPQGTRERIAGAFREQITALVDEGVDLLVLETFNHLEEVRLALNVAREIFSGLIVVQLSFEADGRLREGTRPAHVGDLLVRLGADVIGANCSTGPAALFEVARKLVGTGVPVSIQPNAGEPRRLDQRAIYMATPEYFGVYARRFLKAGVRMVGGCCGTRPEHIAAVAGAVRMFGGGRARAETTPSRAPATPREEHRLEPLPPRERSPLGAKITRIWHDRLAAGTGRRSPSSPDEFVVSVEVNPPAGLTLDKPLAAARRLLAAGIDVINIADGPRAAVRMNNTALALTLRRELGAEILLHVCCRDRNLLGLQSDILGAHALGLRNLVIITGDPPKLGDYPKATAVFDLDSIELLRLVDGLNRGIDPTGRMVGEQTSFFLATGAEPAASDYDRELERLATKVEAGADLVMTQPVYDERIVERFLDDTRELGVPILLGLCPLVSHRNAEFLHHEVPGMSVPEAIRERMRAAGKGPEAVRTGAAIAREMLEAFQDRVVGTYIMPQLGRYKMVQDVLAGLGYGEPGS